MKITVSALKKVSLVIFCLLVLSVALFVGYKFLNKVAPFNPYSEISLDKYECKIPYNYNVFFDNSNKIVAGIKDKSAKEIWEMTEISPVVLGYETVNSIDYMVGAVKDSSGKCKRVLLAYSVQLDSLKEIEDPNLYDSIMINNEFVSPTAIPERFPVGKQVIAMYLSKAPSISTLSDEFCKSNGAAAIQFCAWDKAQSEYGFEPKDLDGSEINDDSLILFIPYWYSFEYLPNPS